MYLEINGARYTCSKRIFQKDTIKFLSVTPLMEDISGIAKLYRDDGFLLSEDSLVKNKKGKKMRGKYITGMQFGRLIAIRPTDRRQGGGVVWECRCNCGNENMQNIEHSGNTVYRASAALRNGNTASCGCLRKETAPKNLAGKKQKAE